MSIKSFLLGLDRRQAAQAARPTIADSFISGTGFFARRQSDAYRNLFPHIDSLAQSFAALTPYAIDGQGDKLADIPAPLAAWLDPNPDNSGRQWARNVAASILYNPYTDILAITSDAQGNYDPSAPATPDNITGYIQLPPDSRRYTGNGSFTCSVRLNIDGQAVQFQADRSHILTFTYSQHPERPACGISPAMVVKKWATVDDFVADYENGFFANNAVPAGIMPIVSQDSQDFEASVRHIESAMGAGNNNRTIFTPVFIDPATGRPLNDTPKVSWIPFQQPNSTIDVKTLSDVVSQRLSNTFGVPDIVRGIDHGQTYANAEQAYRNFITFTLRPFAVNIYDQYVHELNRITEGALDWTVSFDLQEPADTDQQKTAAEANQLNTSAFAQLINLGASPAQAAAALDLPDTWAELDARPAIADSTAAASAATSASYAARQPLSQTRRQAQSAARRIVRNSFKKLLEQTKTAEFAADSKKKQDDTAALAATTAAALLQAYEQLITQAASQVGDDLKQQLREAARNNPAIAALLASTPNVYNDAQARAAWLQHLTADCANSFADAQDRISAMLQDDDGDDSQARRYLNHTRTPLLADNETHLTERHGQAIAAAAIAAHYANVAHVVKTWETRGDDDVCEECQAMEGTTIPASASFGANCEYDGQPSCHPNCRCRAVYTLKID